MNAEIEENIKIAETISIKGARVHNLKNIDVEIPRNELVIITGLSGSGKSSLAFDTLYAEGQRRYVESLSAYARQFLGRMNKPDVDYIHGISPAIAIEQKVISRNPRSTVGTTTEIYDYLKLLFARIGTTYSPISGNKVKRFFVSDVVDQIQKLPKETAFAITCPLILKPERNLKQQLSILIQQGYSRAYLNDEMVRIEDLIKLENIVPEDINLLIDRVIVDAEGEYLSRVADSINTAFYEGNGDCNIWIFDSERKIKDKLNFNNRFELDGIKFEEPTLDFFSFNNPVGACKKCEGFGWVLGIDEDLVVPDKTLSVYEDAVVCWKGEKMSEWKQDFIHKAASEGFPIHRPYKDLTAEQKKLLWEGNHKVFGINFFFKQVEEQTYKIQYRVMLSRYRGRTVCPDCRGTKLRKDASYVKIAGKSIIDLVLMPVSELETFINEIKLSEYEQKVASRILIELKNRLGYLNDVGLGYLTLNRSSNTLSGGESQRIHLATNLGSSLVGSIYILDEPSIGLHPRDTKKLVSVVKKLRDNGNTVVVVEHDEEFMRAADTILDLGPKAGSQGGELVFQGNHKQLLKAEKSLTAKYLTGKMQIQIPDHRRKWNKSIQLQAYNLNNIKEIQTKIPLEVLTVITGVSGSGKTTLIKEIFYPLAVRIPNGEKSISNKNGKIEGDFKFVTQVEMIDQNPIGKSTRSNPVTYLKIYDDIRNLFANQKIAKMNNLKPLHFSFNVAGGRCEECEGEGTVAIEMQFMPDIVIECESCHGKRFKEEILEVTFEGKNIYDILELTIDDAIIFFKNSEDKLSQKISERLQPLQDVGLGYVKMGQSSSTLSGGEAQRIKLASFLAKSNIGEKILFIFDEPTTGLHFYDVQKLLDSLQALINQGHTVVVIEHNLDVIKCADWIIDIGPDSGDKGGNIVFEGLPEDLIKEKNSFTAKFLKEKLRPD